MNVLTRFMEGIAIYFSMTSTIRVLFSLLLLTALAVLSALVTKKVLLRLISRIVKNNKLRWDDIFFKNRVFDLLSYIIPAIVVYMASPILLQYQAIIQKLAITYTLVIATLAFGSVLNAVNEIYRSYPIAKTRSIKGLLQVIKIIVYIIMGIAIVANLMGESPFILLGSIGALTALLSLIFRDPILGFVAGIQLTGNDMLRIGDWIEMSKYGADGDVLEITMTTVIVQNFDMSIVSIPAYALISDSFRNWRGMSEAGGRRMKRSIRIDINTIQFCTPDMIEKFKKIHLLERYMEEKLKEIEAYNAVYPGSDELLINGRRLTNIGTFRAYIIKYLESNANINKAMTLMVRQLQPEDNGVSLEIYAFTNTTAWTKYESIQADIFDHILAAAPEFGLRIYQQPSGNDLRHL